jgi:hypothetical protein
VFQAGRFLDDELVLDDLILKPSKTGFLVAARASAVAFSRMVCRMESRMAERVARDSPE